MIGGKRVTAKKSPGPPVLVVLHAEQHAAWTCDLCSSPLTESKEEVNLFLTHRQRLKGSVLPKGQLGYRGNEIPKPNVIAQTGRKSPCAPCQALHIQLAVTASSCRDKNDIEVE